MRRRSRGLSGSQSTLREVEGKRCKRIGGSERSVDAGLGRERKGARSVRAPEIALFGREVKPFS